MSRSRNIKPGFFENEVLVSLPFEYRLLFIGLWTLADRSGRLEDRPTRIKMKVFPADNVDTNAGLQSLHDSGFICRYSVDECSYIQILAWEKHQNPHIKEAVSTIPAPCKNSAIPVQASEIPEPARLIPDSGFLIPDSLKKQKGGKPPAPALPDWLPETAWADWHAFRNSRKGWTHKARELSLRTLTKLHAKGHDPTAVIEKSIENGWTGLFEIKPEISHANLQSVSKPSAVERVAQAIRDRRANDPGDDQDAALARIGYG